MRCSDQQCFAHAFSFEGSLSVTNFSPLSESALYKVESRKKLANILFSSLPTIQALADQKNSYRSFEVEHGGKQRSVERPRPALARLQRRVFQILDCIEKPDYLHSGRKSRSYITNAQVHVGWVPLVKLDIKKFYASVSSAHIYRLFHDVLRCSPDVAGLLAKLCTADGHLPIGSSSSQLLAFFSSKKMFDELHAHSIKHGVKDSCYVDDLTWSGMNATPKFLWAAKQIVHHHGFKYHGDRTHLQGESTQSRDGRADRWRPYCRSAKTRTRFAQCNRRAAHTRLE
jgi:hypothetical protein